MARKKKEKEKSNFTSWEQVGNALCEITQINTRVKAAEVQMERDKLTITNAYEQKVRDDLAHKEQLEKDMKLYTKEHIDEFTDLKTKKFTYGKVGFKKSTEIVTRNVKAILEALKRNKMLDCITTKVTESINKTKLGEYDDKALLKVGAKRKESEKYFYEVPEEKLEG